MSTETETRNAERQTEQGFVETARGVQQAEGAAQAADAEERARAWRAVLARNLI